MSEEHWHGPVVSLCWATFDIHDGCLLFYCKSMKKAFIPPKAKAILTLQPLTNTEELVAEMAEMAHWDQLNAAQGRRGSVGVFVVCSLVKATSGSRAEARGDGSWVCLLCKQDQILPPHRPREASYAGAEGALSQAVTPGGAEEHEGVTYCPVVTRGTRGPLASLVAMRLSARWPGIYPQRKRGSAWVSQLGAYQGSW